MVSYKSLWEERYRASFDDWNVILDSPVLDAEGKWAYGGPARIDTELDGVLKLAMGGAPSDMVKNAIQRVVAVIDAVDSLGLLQFDARHRANEFSHIKYIRGMCIVDLFEGGRVPLERWSKLGSLEVSLSDALKGDRESICAHRLDAALYLLIGEDAMGALDVLDSTVKVSVRSEEFAALHGLASLMISGEGCCRGYAGVLDYFEKTRSPIDMGREFRRGLPGIFCWALLVGKFVDPGDGELNAERAVRAMGR